MTIKILVVEDENIVAKDIRRTLQGLGYEVPETVATGEEALERAERLRPDLVLMDIALRGAMDGIEAADRIRKRWETPVIYLTAHADPGTLRRAKITEPFGYVLKPFEERDLHTTIEMALYKHSMEKQLRESQRWLYVTLNSIGDAVIATDLEGRTVFINPVAQQLTGWNATEAVGRPMAEIFRIVNEYSREPVENPVTKVLRDGVIVGLANHTLLIARDGRERAIDDSGAPIQDAHGQILGAVLVFRDITERRQLERTLTQQAADLAEADRRKNEFLAMLSHELRNPLAAVCGALELVRSGLGEEDCRMAHDIMERQTQHMVRMVHDLLDVSRVARGHIELRKEPVDLATAVQHAIEESQRLIQSRGHQLTVSLPAEPMWIEADRVRLAQMIANLLDNAAKYTAEGGQIWLTAQANGVLAEVRVRDNGIGISPEMLPRVFDLFSQADCSLDRSQGGLGVGLAVVRTLAEMQGGAVEAHSTGLGQGSEFILRLPLSATPASNVEQCWKPSRVDPRRILVVDDNKGAAEVLQMLLTRTWGHEVRVAHDGTTALQLAKTFRPDLVLLDIGLPGMNGYEVARHLRRQPETTQATLVALSGYSQDESRGPAAETHFDTYLVKPASLTSLEPLFHLARPPSA
ncbi:MAG TPA: response regulator [Pirellulales bacterium]